MKTELGIELAPASLEPPLDYRWYYDQAHDFAKDYLFDKTIECLKLAQEAERNFYKLTIDKRASRKYCAKYLMYCNKYGTADFYYLYKYMATFYVKMSVSCLREYWMSLRTSPYYEDNSYFKIMVEDGILEADDLQARGYVYKPQSKANQERFLAYAKEKGWR